MWPKVGLYRPPLRPTLFRISERPNDPITQVCHGTKLCPHSSVTSWNALPRKASPVASVWRVCGVFWIHHTLVFSCTILNIGRGISKNTVIKALWFFTWMLESNSLWAVAHIQSMLMCQDMATLSLVNTLAHIALQAAWYANRELVWSLGSEKALKLNILLS